MISTKPRDFFKKFIKLISPRNVCFFLLRREVNVARNQIYEILPGLSSREIAYDLAAKKIIKDPALFNYYIKLKHLDKNLQSGRFTFSGEPMDMVGLVRFLTSGARAKEITLTIPEGYTASEIAGVLTSRKIAQADDFLQLVERRDLEGYLFPDTYRLYEDSTARELIEKMLANFERKLTPDLRAEILRQGHSVKDVVIMASILEKEVRTEQDMKLAADILWRRLNSGWLLQVDSSLNYVLATKDPALSYASMQIDSPYNTYKHQGLPPTAIGNPGLQAILAAIYPLANDYWFYLSKPSGETVFARTLAEQESNKEKYFIY